MIVLMCPRWVYVGVAFVLGFQSLVVIAYSSDRADAAVDGFLTDGLVHMVNDENSTPLLLGKLDERTELPPYLVCRVDPRFLSDIC